MASNKEPKRRRKGYTLEQCEAILRESPAGVNKLLAIALQLGVQRKRQVRKPKSLAMRNVA